MSSPDPLVLVDRIGKPLAQAFPGWEEVRGELVKVQENCFAILDDAEDGVPRDEIKIHGLLWAGSEGAALRAWFSEIEADDESRAAGSLSNIKPYTYAAILSELKDSDLSYIESASYRIMSDGKFIHKSIQTKGITYFFRSQEIENFEPAYAVLHTST